MKLESANSVKPSILCKGAYFKTWNDFAEALEAYCDSTFEPIFSISDCKTVVAVNRSRKFRKIPTSIGYYHCTINCVHYGKYESSSRGLRPEQRTSCLDCPAKVRVSFDSKTNELLVRECALHGDKPVHTISKEIYERYPINR